MIDKRIIEVLGNEVDYICYKDHKTLFSKMEVLHALNGNGTLNI